MARDLNNQAKCSQSEDKEIVNEARKLWKATRIGHIKLGLLRYLSQKDAHGYELIRELQARTGGFLSPVAGSVYPILREFELKGYITGTWKTTKGGRKVKVYTLPSTYSDLTISASFLASKPLNKGSSKDK